MVWGRIIGAGDPLISLIKGIESREETFFWCKSVMGTYMGPIFSTVWLSDMEVLSIKSEIYGVSVIGRSDPDVCSSQQLFFNCKNIQNEVNLSM